MPKHVYASEMSFNRWSSFNELERITYVYGTIDALQVFHETQKIYNHLRKCMYEKRTSFGHISTNIRSFGQARPDINSEPMAFIVHRYMIEFCGPLKNIN
jgi:hypothetical protein